MSRALPRLFDVRVYIAGRGTQSRQPVGSWRGVVRTVKEAREAAHREVWQERFADSGMLPALHVQELAPFLACERWPFSWTGSSEFRVRWIYDRRRADLLRAEVLNADGRWSRLPKSEWLRLKESLKDVLDVDATPADFEGVSECSVIPDWAVEREH